MVSAFLLLAPWAPYAVFQVGAPASGPVVSAASGDAQGPCVPHLTNPTGFPACPDTGDPIPPPLSDGSVRKASRGWEWKALETPGWKLLMADHFVLRGDVPIDDLRAAGAYLEEFHRMLQRSIGGDSTDIMFSVRIFADPKEFRFYASMSGAANAESFYDPRSAELVMCLDRARGRTGFQKTLAHEFAHQYMDRVWKRTDPLWFAEGMAEYFAGFVLQDGQVRPGAPDREALRRLREGKPVPLKRFLKMDRDEMYGASFPLLYAQAWSLVHYLFSRNDGPVDLLLRGGALEAIDEIEKSWLEHLKKLE